MVSGPDPFGLSRLNDRLTAAAAASEPPERPRNVPGFADVNTDEEDAQLRRVRETVAALPPPPSAEAARTEAPTRGGFGKLLVPFDKLERNVVDPLQGAIIGWEANAIERLQGFSDLINVNGIHALGPSRHAEAERASNKEKIALFRNLGPGEFNRQRREQFPGEKLLSSIVFDPTSFIGFGLAAKIPKIGITGYKATVPGIRVSRTGGWSISKASNQVDIGLGTVENAFIRAMDAPYRFTSKLLRAGIPKTNAQKEEVSRLLAHGVGRRFVAELPDDISQTQFVQRLAEITSPNIDYNTLTPAARAVRDTVLTPMPKGKGELSSWRKLLDNASEGTTEQAHQFNRIHGLHALGLLDTSYAAEKMVVLLGGSLDNPKHLTRMITRLKTDNELWHRQVAGSLSTITPDTLATDMSTSAGRYQRKNNLLDKTQWEEHHATIAGILNTTPIRAFNDKIIGGVWKQVVQRLIARPLAASLLSTPGFILDNVQEGITRPLLNGSASSLRGAPTRARYSSLTKGLTDRIPVQDPDIVNVTRFQDITFDVDSAENRFTKVMQWTGSKFRDASNVLEIGYRRAHLTGAMSKRLYSVYGDDAPWLIEAVENLPMALQPYKETISEYLMLRSASGLGPEGIRQLVDDFTVGDFIANDVAQALASLDHPFITAVQKEHVYSWLEAGAPAARMEAVRDDMYEATRWAFSNTGKRNVDHIRITLDFLNSIDRSDPKAMTLGIRLSEQMHNAADEAIFQMNQTAARTVQALRRRKNLSPAVRNKLAEDNAREVENYLVGIEQMKDEINTALGRFSPDLAASFDNHLTVLSKHWRDDLAAVKTHMDSTPAHARGKAFWDEYYDIRRDNWESPVFNAQRTDFLESLRRISNDTLRGGKSPLPEFPSMVIDGTRPLTLSDIATAVGSDTDQVVKAIINVNSRSREGFINTVRSLSKEFNVTIQGDFNKRVGEVFDQVYTSMTGSSHRYVSEFDAVSSQLDNFWNDVENMVTRPVIGEEQVDELRAVFNRVAEQHKERWTPDLQRKADDAIAEGVEDTKQTFANYSDQNALDATMAHIFPFWTYEARRIPFILNQAAKHPKLFDMLGPDGSYYERTDNGYLPFSFGGFQFAPLSGTFFGTTKRALRPEIDPPDNWLESAINRAEQFGFYLGPLQRQAAYFALGDTENVGELITPPFQIPLTALEALPGGVGQRISKLRNEWFPDKFFKREVIFRLGQAGHDVSKIDPDTLRPLEGSGITDDDVHAAIKSVNVSSTVSSQIGKTRYRTEDQLHDQRIIESFYQEKGISLEDQRSAKRQGISLEELMRDRGLPALTVAENNFLQSLPGADAKRVGNNLLREGEARKQSLLKVEFWQDWNANLERVNAKKQEAYDLWWEGKNLGAFVDIIQAENRQLGNLVHTMRGRDPDDPDNLDVPGRNNRYFWVPLSDSDYDAWNKKWGNGFEPIFSPVEELLTQFYSIRPTEDLETGTLQMNAYFEKRNAFIRDLPEESRDVFMDELRKTTLGPDGEVTPETYLWELQQGILGSYWDLDDQAMRDVGAEKVVDAYRKSEITRDLDALNYWKNHPQIKRWRKRSTFLKEQRRLASPRTEYALFMFGFIKTPKNATTLQWIRQDGNRPNVSRFN